MANVISDDREYKRQCKKAICISLFDTLVATKPNLKQSFENAEIGKRDNFKSNL